jgi:DNA-binding IclR family transcriptional regulator
VHIGDVVEHVSNGLTEDQRANALFLPEVLEQVARALAAQDDYLVDTIDARRTYSVISISSPVIDADGAPILLLSLWGFTLRMTGTEIDDIGARLAAATSDLSRSLSVTRPLTGAR